MPQRFEIQARTISSEMLDLLVTTVHIRDRFFAIIIEDVTRWKEAQAKVQLHSEELVRETHIHTHTHTHTYTTR